MPVVLIKYKAPHKFPLAEIIAGLSREIWPAKAVIKKNSDVPEFLSKLLLAAVVTWAILKKFENTALRERGYAFLNKTLSWNTTKDIHHLTNINKSRVNKPYLGIRP